MASLLESQTLFTRHKAQGQISQQGAAFRTSLDYTRRMLASERITQIAREVAQANTTPRSIGNVLSQPAIGPDGEDIVRITIVVEPDAVEKLSGDAVLDILVQTRDRLREA